MDKKDVYIEQLENTIKNLQNQVNNLTEMILILRKKKFGSTSEKAHRNDIDGQLSIFNKAELVADESIPEPVSR